ncbi:L-Ala-D/L-amino acid epimerase-like [Cucurbita moschata]|uniref:L-Ala-D/L-amino acid epimerase-like n=1 Tax=Cucurbita moschata TaxID=3662 RepID=A0A6J1FEM1_CUCMO|nr:L-Ala-D/L-amino acid epimerase-like [Cucurbita moschata]
MALVLSAALLPFSSSLLQRLPRSTSKLRVVSSHGGGGVELIADSAAPSAERVSFGFKNLAETFWVNVQRAEGRPFSVGLNSPLYFGDSKLETVENVAIRVELKNGCVGWGEVQVSVTDVNLETVLAKAEQVCSYLRHTPPATLNSMFDDITGLLSPREFAPIRAGVEMALIDAVANSIRVPLWRLFGGVTSTLTTAITVPIVSPAEATILASKYYNQGFGTLKLVVGKNFAAELAAIEAIHAALPCCSLMFDANEGYTAEEAIKFLEKLKDMGIVPLVFEQPVDRDDWKGLRQVSNVARTYGIPVAVDESCRSLTDVQKIIDENLVDAINIKLPKFGVLGVLEITNLARKSGLTLMVDSMAETRLATGFAGHLAAGVGCFKYIVLDTPFLLAEDPVVGGYEVSGAVYKFNNARGQGGFLNWDLLPEAGGLR